MVTLSKRCSQINWRTTVAGSLKVFLTLFLLSFVVPISKAQNITTAFHQAANGAPPTSSTNLDWIGGILQSSNSRYAEGMSTLQRLVIRRIAPADNYPYKLRIKMDATKSGLHAYDFITSWQQALDAANAIAPNAYLLPPNLGSLRMNQCGTLSGSDLTVCNTVHDALPSIIPKTDINGAIVGGNTASNVIDAKVSGETDYTQNLVGFGSTDQNQVTDVVAAYESTFGDRYVRLYSDKAIIMARVTFVKYEAGQVFYDIEYRAPQSTYLLVEFAGHIANGLSLPVMYNSTMHTLKGYGTARGASQISGGPYHISGVSYTDVSGNDVGNIGSLDNQLQGADIISAPECGVSQPAQPCREASSIQFRYTGGTTGVTYSWNVTGGNAVIDGSNTGSSINVIPQTASGFTPGATITATLTVSKAGLVNICTGTVVVLPSPVAAFTTPTAQCLSGNSFSFSSTSSISSGSITNTVWNFGDGTTATGTSATHTYASAGTYAVKLVVTSDNGCKDSVTHNVTVNPQPVAAFTAPTAQCYSGNSFSFSSTSSISSGTIASVLWYFGDGSTAATTPATHSYATPGIYTVKLVVTSDLGCKDSVTHNVTVYASPVAAFTAPVAQCLSGNSFSFSSTSSISSGSITNTAWNFGDGTTATGTSATHTYASAGTYAVKLVVTSDNGCKDSVTHNVTVNPQPVAAFTAPTAQCYSGNSFSFSSTSSISSGSITNTAWNFGDGTTATGTSATHTYASAGTYAVKLVVTSDNGCKDSVTKNVTVYANPVASFTAPVAQCYSGNSFSFTSTSTISSGSITSTMWYFGDGTTSTGTPATHTYAAAGTYDVKLVVSNNGCKDSVTHSVTVYASPVADFTTPTAQCLSGNSFSFASTSTISSGSITSVLWNFGDGNTANTTTATHTYASAGTYAVKLVVTSDNGCKDSVTKNVTVNPQPVASFTAPTAQCYSGNSFSFTSTSTLSSGSITNTRWYFGDGTTSTGTPATHTYAAAGTYHVKLVVETNLGCKDSVTHDVIVYDSPVASFSAPTSQCLSGNSFSFSSSSTVAGGSITNSTWYFGDGTSATGTSATHTYAAAGAYNVKLVVTTNNGCKDSVTHSVTVNPQPVAAFTAPIAQCLSGNSFSFSSTSSVASGSISNTAWYFGDGITANGATATHTYASAGTYSVKLVVTSNLGCKDSVTHDVTVNPQPTISGESTVCIGKTTQLTGSATAATTNPWSSSNTSVATVSNTGLITGVAAGTAVITYTNSNGCQQTATINVIDCGVVYGIYSQGYYGNIKGSSCMTTFTADDTTTKAYPNTADLLKDLLKTPMYVGKGNRMLTIPEGTTTDLINIMPGGGTPTAMPAGGPWALPLYSTPQPKNGVNHPLLTKQGRINNVLLSQAITVKLATRLSGIGKFPLEYMKDEMNNSIDSWFETQETQSCGTQRLECGGWAKFTLPKGVTTYLTKAGTSKATVSNLLDLADSLLGKVVMPGDNVNGYTVPSYADVANTLSTLVDAFHSWRYWPATYGVDYIVSNACPETIVSARTAEQPQTVAALDIKQLQVSAYPNPFTDVVKFTIASPVSGQAQLEVYNMMGQKVKVVYNGYVEANKAQVVEYHVGTEAQQNLIYKLNIGGQQVTGKLLNVRR